MKKQVFAYIRVSGDSQISKGGFPRQEKAIKDYTKANNMEVIRFFREQGVSGTIEDRPALAELMVSLEQNGHGIETVIVERLDRLARDLMVQEAIIRDFHSKGFQLISTTEGTDLAGNDPTRKLIRQVFGAISEYDKTMTVLKLRAARERQRKLTGKCEGRKGYKEHDASILRKIHALRRQPKSGKRLTWQQIADRLNAEGVTTLDGKRWTLYRVQQVAKGYDRRGGR